MTDATRWATDHDQNHSNWYIERFRKMAADGVDLDGEARLVDAMLPRRARILDAGCGPGRVGAALAQRGHTVVGVDADPKLIDAARTDHAGVRWLVADLATLNLAEPDPTEPGELNPTELNPTDSGEPADPAEPGEPELFDAAVLAGNVMLFVAPGSEVAVLTHVGRHVRPGGFVIVGFGLERGYALPDFDADAAAAGLELEQRFGTWDLRPLRAESTFAVSVLRRPAD